MGESLGGRVAPAPQRESGHATVTFTGRTTMRAAGGTAAALLDDLPGEIRVWASHGDFVAAPPKGFSVLATSANAPVAAMAHPDRRLYALLFHPEVAHTERGLEILRNFAYGVGGWSGGLTIASVVGEAAAEGRGQG